MEIERKFIINLQQVPDYVQTSADRFEITQRYINYSPEIRVRALGEHYYFTIKRPLDEAGLAREEVEFQITEAEYKELIQKQVGSTICKTRYRLGWEGNHLFIDVYKGGLTGLVVAEVEFDSLEEAGCFKPPDWFGREITGDRRYKNASLAKEGISGKV